MKKIAFSALGILAISATAFADDGLSIRSEDEFVQDHKDEVEQVAPGVYLFVDGELAGKTVSIGRAGLEYDLGLHRARILEQAKAGRGPGMSAEIVRDLERVQRQYDRIDAARAGDVGTLVTNTGTIQCYARTLSGSYATFYGDATVNATVELYKPNGGGGLNPYYARALADATGYVYRPASVPSATFLSVGAYAEDVDTGEVSSDTKFGSNYATTSVGPVYSGVVFTPNMLSFAYVEGIGSCSGYVSVSDDNPY